VKTLEDQKSSRRRSTTPLLVFGRGMQGMDGNKTD
jgi:hypothetical protein